MSIRILFATGLTGISLALMGAACAPSDSGSSAPSASVAESEAAGKLGDQVITMAELDERIKEDLFRRQSEDGDPSKLYEMRSAAIETLITERLLDEAAEAQGISRDELMERESERLMAVSDEEVRAFFDENESRLGGRSFEELEEQIRQHLESRRGPEAAREYVAKLREGQAIEIYLEVPRIEVAADGPGQGPDGAPITIVEFSDYQCPYCKRAEPTIKQVLERYGDQIRFVFRHFPLDSIHPQARPASEAAACADEQGKFWEYHALLFAPDADLSSEALTQYATDLSLDVDAFNTCVSERRYQDKVEADLQAGRAAGVSGTPAFFVNGISLNGARPVDDFVRVIEGELAGQG